ncbi:MAG: thioredoxin family protein [Methylacidiphilales bacterium]|nr:thioredoxin family protein [Candidatus Methylacidiphilales bacterium]
MLVGVALVGAGPAAAADLVYVRDPGCSYCRAFDAEIGPVYDKTPEGRQARLRPVEMRSHDLDAIRLVQPIRYTPTFVLVADGAEVGRIEGYPGEEFFWVRLAKLLETLPPASLTPASISPATSQ